MASVDPNTHAQNLASRNSTYSVSAPSVASTGTNDSSTAEIREITSGLQRMENKALIQQRVALSDDKVENLRKLALGAKLERALDRRMSSQDAVMRPRRGTTSAIPSAKPEDHRAATADDGDSKTVVSLTDEKSPVMVEMNA